MNNQKKSKICFFHNFPFNQDKANNLLHIIIRMANLLREFGEIHFLYAGEVDVCKLEDENIICHNIPLVRYPIIGHVWYLLSLNWSIYWVSQKYEIDFCVNLNNHYFIILAIPGILLSKSRLIARVAGIRTDIVSGKSNITRRIRSKMGIIFENLSLMTCERIIALSSSLGKLLIQRSILPLSHKIMVISQGVDIEKFHPVLKSESKTDIEFLFIGRLSKLKGLEYALRAFKRIYERYPYTRFLIVGEGKERKFLEKLTVQENIQSVVEFRGYVSYDKLPKIYNSAYIFVLPSLSEGLPNVILEAQASGLPVIGTKVGGIPELLSDGRGILVSPANEQQLFEAMETLVRNVALREKIVKKAREYVVENHSLEALRQRYLEILYE